MNVLFLTMSKVVSIETRGIYTDLMRKFRAEGHTLFIVSPSERREGHETQLIEQDGVRVLSVKTLNLQKTNVVEKGLGQLSIEFLYKKAIKKYCNDIHFDLILYSTPPITFPKVISYVKKKNPGAKTYLLLKDIFPQNAVDMGMLKKSGLKGILYKFFRNKEKKLYALSDYIGCMSPANVNYVLKHNPEVALRHIQNPIVELAPNSIELIKEGTYDKKSILEKYELPIEKTIFIYGGNLGAPQGIPFLIECMKANKDRGDCHFVVVGNGTFYPILEKWYKEDNPSSVTLIQRLPKEDYDKLVAACHVGLIFLDYRFEIPNFPSRLLPYLANKMPVLACTDPNCDIGQIASENGFGMWCPSNNVEAFSLCVDQMIKQDIKAMGMNGYEFLKKNYLVEHTYKAIIKHF